MCLSSPNESEASPFGPKNKPAEQEAEMTMMPSKEPGFAVQGRPADSERPETAFDQLVLPSGHKRMLLSLVAQHFRDKEATSEQGIREDDRTDIVRGKGIGISLKLPTNQSTSLDAGHSMSTK